MVEAISAKDKVRILSIDPGAERCGVAIIDSDPLSLVHSSILGLPRNGSDYQLYRLLLIDLWQGLVRGIFNKYHPDTLVSEIVPAPRGGNYGALAQMNLAATVITTIQSIAFYDKIEVNQIAANKVKLKIGGAGDASKVKVRNGVYQILPETKKLIKYNWSKVFDESDAIAVGLAYLGYNIKEFNGRKK